MWSNGRRCIIHAWHTAREQFAALVAERDELKAENETLKRQWDWLLQELRNVTAELRQLRAAAPARQRAHSELTALYRERDIERAKRAERDLSQPLQ